MRRHDRLEGLLSWKLDPDMLELRGSFWSRCTSLLGGWAEPWMIFGTFGCLCYTNTLQVWWHKLRWAHMPSTFTREKHGVWGKAP